jgi:hypothetical protein
MPAIDAGATAHLPVAAARQRVVVAPSQDRLHQSSTRPSTRHPDPISTPRRLLIVDENWW